MDRYIKQVVWMSPFLDQTIPIGYYGMTYTRVLLDIPGIDKNRDIWNFGDTFPEHAQSAEHEIITLYTSVPFLKGTLSLYANGEEVEITEAPATVSTTFKVNTANTAGKYIYCSYVPGDIDNYIGNTVKQLEEIYGVVAGIAYSTKLRDTINRARLYTDSMLKILKLSPEMWIGGFANNEIGTLQPGITEADIELHIEPLRKRVDQIAKAISGLGYVNVRLPSKDATFTIDVIESIQESLTSCDEGIEELVNQGKIIL